MKITNIFWLLCLWTFTAHLTSGSKPDRRRFSRASSFPVGTTYYVSSSLGNDSNNGLSEGKPFATIGKVNGLDLQPGDQVRFKCGDTWRAEQLVISKSGTRGRAHCLWIVPRGLCEQAGLFRLAADHRLGMGFRLYLPG